jgi:hypothetical protein
MGLSYFAVAAAAGIGCVVAVCCHIAATPAAVA